MSIITCHFEAFCLKEIEFMKVYIFLKMLLFIHSISGMQLNTRVTSAQRNCRHHQYETYKSCVEKYSCRTRCSQSCSSVDHYEFQNSCNCFRNSCSESSAEYKQNDKNYTNNVKSYTANITVNTPKVNTHNITTNIVLRDHTMTPKLQENGQCCQIITKVCDPNNIFYCKLEMTKKCGKFCEVETKVSTDSIHLGYIAESIPQPYSLQQYRCIPQWPYYTNCQASSQCFLCSIFRTNENYYAQSCKQLCYTYNKYLNEHHPGYQPEPWIYYQENYSQEIQDGIHAANKNQNLN